MNHPTVTKFLDQLDFTDPGDLVLAFHHFRRFPTICDLSETAWLELLHPIAEHAPAIFGVPDHEDSAAAVSELLWAAGGYLETDRGAQRPQAPREWLCIFRYAHERGLIGPIAFGAAVRFLLVQSEGCASPGHRPTSLQVRQAMVADAKNAAPHALMTPAEVARRDALPDTVTLWRGGFYGGGSSPQERAQSLFWAIDREYAERYIGAQRGAAMLGHLRRGMDPLRAIDTCDTDEAFLLRADVPKELVLAYIGAGVSGELTEVWLDFPKLTDSMVQLEHVGGVSVAA